MAISTGDLKFCYTNGVEVPDGSLHNLFPAGVVGGPAEYALLEFRNTHATLTLTAVRVWIADPTGGGVFAVAVADGVSRPLSYLWPDVDEAALTYSTASTKSAGLALPDLAPGRKVLLAARRVLSGATPAHPEVCRLVVGGASPI